MLRTTELRVAFSLLSALCSIKAHAQCSDLVVLDTCVRLSLDLLKVNWRNSALGDNPDHLGEFIVYNLHFCISSELRCLRVVAAIVYPIPTPFQRATAARSSWNLSTSSTIRLPDFRSRLFFFCGNYQHICVTRFTPLQDVFDEESFYMFAAVFTLVSCLAAFLASRYITLKAKD